MKLSLTIQWAIWGQNPLNVIGWKMTKVIGWELFDYVQSR